MAGYGAVEGDHTPHLLKTENINNNNKLQKDQKLIRRETINNIKGNIKEFLVNPELYNNFVNPGYYSVYNISDLVEDGGRMASIDNLKTSQKVLELSKELEKSKS